MSRHLIQKGHEVIAVDNFFTGSKSNVVDLLDSRGFELIRHDITFPLYLECDLIMNFACPASPLHYQHNPVQTIKTNVHGSINLLGLAKRLGVPIFQASTSEVYGDPSQHPQTESYWGNVNPIGIRACYDEGKRAAETLFFDYHRQFGTKIKIARIFNTYGPAMAIDDGRVVSNFIVAALRGEPLRIYGDGSQTRSLCYVSDLIDGIYSFVFDSSETGPMNLGTDNEITVKQIAEKVLELTNSKSLIVHEPLPSDDPRQRRPDLSLARRSINWLPKVDLDSGLKATVDYFKGRVGQS